MKMAVAGSLKEPPRHVAIIMDGNGRWALSHSLPRTEGHRRGADAVKQTVRACLDLNIDYLTLFAFSSENWKRPKAEVQTLMGLLRFYLRSEIDALIKSDVRLRVIGDRQALEQDIQKLIHFAEDRTKENSRLNLTVALNYGGRREILLAVRAMVRDATVGELDLECISEKHFEERLETHGIPDPDLLIRTSGECRLSNFLLWQCAYSELVFVETLWPDFGKEELISAIEDFNSRERRYGGTRE
ncbi:MAG: di-trans,poly-cis-decaprenylcistransferase [Rhodospirillaceae bacterium]|nr:di-trans,poly-cis-decaprenylcistransferase [Rhodospirillaceae bacterium]|tara:strand:- start:260 stop:991 length:732 start_codon:yes stop_codon:yes gene_type:complete